MNYADAKVLALQSGCYFNVLKKIYVEGKRNLGWEINIITTSEYMKPYTDFIDSTEQLIILPNWLEKQPWEDEPYEVEKIIHIMRESERITKIPVNRILLSNERSIGRAYSKRNYYWPENKLARCALKNNEVPESVLMRSFKFAMDVLEKMKPTLCLGSPTGGIVNTTFYFVTRYLNIPYVACMASLVASKRHFWACDWGTFNTRIAYEFSCKLENHDKPSESSLQYIKKFQKRPKPFPIYQFMWGDKNRLINFYNINKNIINRTLNRLIPIVKRQKVSEPKPLFQFIIYNYRTYFLQMLQKRFYRVLSEDELSTMKYIYYPFHLDPEIVLNVQAPFWHNQLNTIKLLSYNLPAGYKLLVREHRYNVGRRSSRYLKELVRLPGVIFIDGLDNQYKYIKNADLVVTVNGTTGFEGIMMGRPVLTLDRTFYDSLGLSVRPYSYLDFGVVILDAIQSYTVDEFRDERIALFIDAEHQVTVDDDAGPCEEINFIQQVVNDSITKEEVELPQQVEPMTSD